MHVNVVFAFDSGAGGETNFFTLDNPVMGELDNTFYTLGGDFSLVDVTDYVRSVSVSRGRSRVLDRVQSGSATVVLDNRARLFDPTAGTAISPYSTSIVPRKNMQVIVNDEPVFSGLVDDWNLDFDISGDATTTAICEDGFITLGQVTVGTTTRSAQTSDARVGAILTEAAWPSAKRVLSTGEITLQADTPGENTNVVDYLQTVTDTEFGAFFMSRRGNAVFKNRSEVQDYSSPVVFGGTGIPFSSLMLDYGTENLYNAVELSRVNGGTASVSDATSQTAYGISEYTKSGLLFDDDTELTDLADYLLSRYKDPTLRVQSITVLFDGLGTADRATVAGLDIADPLQVTFTPSVGSAITQYASLDRIDHNISPSAHSVTLSMSQAQASFILDSGIFGELDDDSLGF